MTTVNRTPQPTPPATRAPTWMKVALVVSLSINLAVVGVIGGSMMRRANPDLAGLDRRQMRIVEMMPEARRAEVAAALRAQSSQVQSVKDALATANSALLQSMRAEPFAPDRLATALAERQKAQNELSSLAHSQLIAQVARLSGSERREMAERMSTLDRRLTDRNRPGE